MELQKQSGQFTEKNILVIGSNTGYGSACTANSVKKGMTLQRFQQKKNPI